MKVAIVLPSGHFFDTPCVPNLAKCLAEKGFKVDLFTAKNLATPTGKLEHPDISIRWFPITLNKSKETIIWLIAGFFFWFGKFLIMNRYDYVIACGIRSLFVVGFLSLIFRFKYIYHSLEIYSGKQFTSLKGRIFKKCESYFNKRAVFCIIQDEKRAQILRRLNSLKGQPIMIFPNSPLITKNNQCEVTTSVMNCDINKKFNIPEGKILILYSGSLSDDWSGCRKIIESTRYFSENWILFLQARTEIKETFITADLETFIKENKVIYSLKPLSEEEYNELVDRISVGLAWYESEDENIKYVGLSSGKISMYLLHGKPIIVNRIPMYDEICDMYKCGIVIDKTEEIPKALDKIIDKYETYSTGAYIAYEDLFNIEKYCSTISEFMK